MSSSYQYPPSDPSIAALLERLTADLEQVPKVVQAHLPQIEQGKMLAELLDIPDAELEEHYCIAYALCDEGQFQHALTISLQLAIHKPNDPRFQFMCGSCLQRLGEPRLAATMYANALQLDPSDAAAAYRLGECFAAVGDKEMAQKAFEITIELGRGHFHYRDLQDWAQSQIASLNQRGNTTRLRK